MKIVSVSIVRNEADLIEVFVRYHLQIVDHMIIINHRSVDSTSKILDALIAEGLSISVLKNNSLRQPQGSALNMALKKAVNEFDADWVLPLDADEFICSNGGGNISEIISGFSGKTIINIPWRTYVPLASDNVDETNILNRVQHCRKNESNQTYKALVPKFLAKKRQGTLRFGSHHYKGKYFYIGKKFEDKNTDKLFLAHFPIRDAEQVQVKAIMGWLSVLAKPDRGSVENFHLRRLYDGFKDGVKISMDEVSNMAYGSHTNDTLLSPEEELVLAPVVPQEGDIELAYGDINRCSPTELLLKMAEEYASAVSLIRKSI